MVHSASAISLCGYMTGLTRTEALLSRLCTMKFRLPLGRSPKSVEWKVQNVSSCDPRPRIEKPISEAPSAQKRLRDVYNWFWKDRQSARELYELFHHELIFGEPEYLWGSERYIGA